MPEMTEALTTKPEEVNQENDSGTDSDGEDSIPELEVMQRIHSPSRLKRYFISVIPRVTLKRMRPLISETQRINYPKVDFSLLS